MFSVEEKVKWFAISTRIFTFVFQFGANYLIRDHDPGVFRKPVIKNEHYPTGNILNLLTEGLTRWDAQYFLHIAEYGYTYENTLAFFPLFPLILRSLAYPFQLVANNAFHAAAVPFFLTTHHSLILMAVVLNNLLFVHSSLALFNLTLKITQNEKFSYITALLFCVNPASIFFSSVYSETLFCFLTLNALLYIENSQLLWGSLLFGLSSMTRSNGLVNIGFIVHRIMKTRRSALSIVFSLIVLVACVILAVMPFVAYQFYCYKIFCHTFEPGLPDNIIKHADQQGYILQGNMSLWCEDRFPLPYAYVQKYHWNIGFLKYYEKKQIPNFLLALPVLSFVFYGVVKFIRVHGTSLLYLGFAPGSPSALIPARCFPYMLHLSALALFSLFFMHIQVTTRFIFSSSPAIYWICAELVLDKMPESKAEAVAKRISLKRDAYFEPEENKSSCWKTIILTGRFLGWGLLVRYYFFAYFLAGPVAFSNNLPWT